MKKIFIGQQTSNINNAPCTNQATTINSKIIFFVTITIFTIVLFSLFQYLPTLAATNATEEAHYQPLSRKVIVLDAGHGGWDPGMVSNKVEEKDINLSITQKVQAFLEQGGATVIITRLDDSDLARNKSGDMNARRLIANTSHADIFVSIHQNAFSSPNVKGAQVFFFNESDNSQKLATYIQGRIKEFVDYNNKFKAKANSNYYVLKQTQMPAVLVECGFLTNYNERNKLTNQDYQEKIAWAIYLGIVDYFNEITPEPSA